MKNKIKFVQKWDDAFLGTEGFGSELPENAPEAPFIAYTDTYVIIVDQIGISVRAEYSDEFDSFRVEEFVNEFPLTYKDAKIAVRCLESLTAERFMEIVLTEGTYVKI